MSINHPTDASVLSALSLAGVRAKLLSPGSPCDEYHHCNTIGYLE